MALGEEKVDVSMGKQIVFTGKIHIVIQIWTQFPGKGKTSEYSRIIAFFFICQYGKECESVLHSETIPGAVICQSSLCWWPMHGGRNREHDNNIR